MTDTITAAEYDDLRAKEMKEHELQEWVRRLARDLGCMFYHTWNSQKSAAGFPDCVIITQDNRLIVAELKREHTKPSAAQLGWLAAFRDAGVETYIWRPSDFISCEIHRILGGT